MAEGMAQIISGDGDRGAASIREAVEALERSGELPHDARLLVWAATGPVWLREEHGSRALVDRVLAAVRLQSAIGVLPSVLTYVAFDQAVRQPLGRS